MFKSFFTLVLVCIIIIIIFVYGCSMLFNDKGRKKQKDFINRSKKMYKKAYKDMKHKIDKNKQERKQEEEDMFI